MTGPALTDPRLSMLRVMAAYEEATAHLERDELGAVAVIFRDLTPDEADLLEDMIAADGFPSIGRP